MLSCASGDQAILTAAAKGNDEVICQGLLHAVNKKQGDVNLIQDNNGDKLVHILARQGRVNSLLELLKLSSDSLLIKDPNGKDPLPIASKHGQIEVVQFLLAETGTETVILGGCDLAVKTLRSHPKVELAAQQLQSEHAVVVAACIMNNTKLTSLDLSNNQLLGDPLNPDFTGVQALARAIHLSLNLLVVNVSGCDIGPTGVQDLVHSIKFSTSMTSLK